MKRGGGGSVQYTPAWQSPSDKNADRKLLGGGVVTSNELLTTTAVSEGRSLLAPRHDGKVVPVCVHIEDNGPCHYEDDDDDDVNNDAEKDRLAAIATTDNHVDEPAINCDSCELEGVQVAHRSRSPATLSSASSMSGDLHAYSDFQLNTSVYDLPPGLDNDASPVLPGHRRLHSESAAVQPRRSRIEGLASDALSAVVRSCSNSQGSRAEDTDVRLSAVSAPAVFVVSNTKQFVIFSVNRSPSLSPLLTLAPPLSHSDHTLNR